MSKVFISYRRKSWGFTHRLADELRQRLDAEVFVDVDSIDQTDFEKSILRHLHESDVVLLVITDLTFADRIHHEDDWVRHEIREALRLGLPIVLVSVDGLLPPLGLPEDIKEVAQKQGIEFYPRYFVTCVDHLIDFVTRVSPVRRKGITGVANITLEPMTLTATATVEDPLERHLKHQEILNTALDLHDNGNHSKSIFLLEELKADGFNSPFVNLDELLADARKYEAIALRRQRAQIGYSEIVALVKRRVTLNSGLKAFQDWQREYPDLVDELDTENIHTQLSPTTSPSVGVHSSVPIAPSTSRIGTATITQTSPRQTSLSLMPKPFDWIDIPAGKVTLGKDSIAHGGYLTNVTTFDVNFFSIAKYPITNGQFAKFVEAKGYEQERWWTIDGWQEKVQGRWREPRYWNNTKWNKIDHPVVGVSWYEAVAFCKWLSALTGQYLMLATEQQWQRAAQGDTNWAYPYGEKFDETRCNCDSQATTSVTKYEGKTKGDSPFGVVDMSGNVAEWCLTNYLDNSIQIDGIFPRMIRGGGAMYGRAPELLRVDRRSALNPHSKGEFRGFRIAQS